MIKLNSLQYPNVQNLHISSELSLDILKNNDDFLKVENELKRKYNFLDLLTFSFSKSGFLGLFLELEKKGKIAVSVGESYAIIQAALSFEALGFPLIWIDLEKNGKVNTKQLENVDVDFIFISSYVIDTFVKTNLEDLKNLTNAKIISNASADFSTNSDAIYFDTYKLTGFALSSCILFKNELFEEQVIGFKDVVAVNSINEALKTQSFETSQKEIFKEKLVNAFGEDLYFFVDSKQTLPFSLHFALKNIKAREIIRTLALNSILITNGEGCSLGLSMPSRVIQAMGYEEVISRNAISLTFTKKYEEEEIEKTVNAFAKKYRQIRVLNEQ
ncbi:cysteine desulfurase [Poseidonibacter ostreae]|uniref:Cysteine desulfurase n=1 Tax=Poseidonibacter ostreae TaxID=2654171 RepID=A0A6L4WSS1_9BACT|nr:cysteine desulfurase [Poseidonibacter ostreae]KAB7887785.1 cysteine desulfurase [Poseidonibacter ostreae]KAB7890952.1 cysteine desulfurase [Poseidonibacter ostreae]MAC84384.1 cysteine desulfurase [Arcobacter sp.]